MRVRHNDGLAGIAIEKLRPRAYSSALRALGHTDLVGSLGKPERARVEHYKSVLFIHYRAPLSRGLTASVSRVADYRVFLEGAQIHIPLKRDLLRSDKIGLMLLYQRAESGGSLSHSSAIVVGISDVLRKDLEVKIKPLGVLELCQRLGLLGLLGRLLGRLGRFGHLIGRGCALGRLGLLGIAGQQRHCSSGNENKGKYLKYFFHKSYLAYKCVQMITTIHFNYSIQGGQCQ